MQGTPRVRRSTISVRAGQYQPQVAGYDAFTPAVLPPDPPIVLTGRMHVHLSEADLALGRLDGSIQTLPNPDLFVYMYVRKEAVLSSQIEGTQSSLNDLLAAESQLYSGEDAKDVDEVINYVAAMNLGIARLAELPVCVRLIKDLHRTLLDGVRGQHLTPGELRERQNWIGPSGCAMKDAVFVPPAPADVPGALGELERFLNDERELPTLVKIGLTHAQFETIHPFLDGNGRIGRLLITFLLMSNAVLHKPVLYLSYYLKEHRQEYYRLLQAVREHGAWEDWLIFFLRGVTEVSAQATETAHAILRLREDDRDRITDGLGRAAGNGYRVLEKLYLRPITSVNEVADLVDVSSTAATSLVDRLVRIGVLEETTGFKRNRRFRYRRYIDLFD